MRKSLAQYKEQKNKNLAELADDFPLRIHGIGIYTY